jgi:hypothetical protein
MHINAMEHFFRYVRTMFCLTVPWHIGCKPSKTVETTLQTNHVLGALHQQQINTTLLAYRNCWQVTGTGQARNLPET